DASFEVGDGDSFDPDISGNGNRISFVSTATNLGSGQNSNAKLFVYDQALSQFYVMCENADADCLEAEISLDGQFVVFSSSATNLIPGLPVGIKQVYRWHVSSGTLELVSSYDG